MAKDHLPKNSKGEVRPKAKPSWLESNKPIPQNMPLAKAVFLDALQQGAP